jgi:2-oxoglutarate ferredoxin oxidoreductase subunit beta
MSGREYSTYLDETRLPYFFCPGCGHGVILDQLNNALVKLQLDPHQVVIVTDIGCSGLADKYFKTNALHGLHGRSVTYATGVKLANPELKVIVLMGDGGCGIGGHHLINAARRNIGVTVIVFNNFNYGMTGGEHSVTTPPGGITASTPAGTLERPMDICGTVALNGASFTARTTTFDTKLPDLLVQAIQTDGFSLVDIWELCTAYYVPNNRFSKGLLDNTLSSLNFLTGVLHQKSQPEYSRAYREQIHEQLGKPALPVHPIQTKYASSLQQPLRCLIAGAAGRKIASAASAFCRGAMMAGLWATQRNDYPVTVKSGHSIGEVILSPQEILYTGIPIPDVLLALFPEGLARVQSRLEQMNENGLVLVSADLYPLQTLARQEVLDFKRVERWGKRKEYWAVMALALLLRKYDFYPLEAYKYALSGRSEFAEDNLAAIEGMLKEV